MKKRKCPSTLAGYCTFWIDHLRAAADLPSDLANVLVRTAIHAAPPFARPTPVEGWIFEKATDHADILNCKECILWLRTRKCASDEAGLIEPAQGQYWLRALDMPPVLSTTPWARRCRTVAQDAEREGFALSPRLLNVFIEHPTWIDAYLCVSMFKAMLSAEQVEPLTDLPPLPSIFPSQLGGYEWRV